MVVRPREASRLIIEKPLDDERLTYELGDILDLEVGGDQRVELFGETAIDMYGRVGIGLAHGSAILSRTLPSSS